MKMWFTVLISFVGFVSVLGQGRQQESRQQPGRQEQEQFALSSECPSPNGFFADSVQCDKYYECEDNVMTEKLCPDGMAFNDLSTKIAACDFIFIIDCSQRPELQPPQPTDVCPRQNGYYPVADESVCNKFYYCAGGTGNLITCPEGLVFSLKTGTCVWPDAAGRSNCVSSKVVNFTCPVEPDDTAIAHPRYADPDDCQFFYVCINGKVPRRNGCSFGQVFNSRTETCDNPTEVPECADYYTEYFENYFAGLSDNTGRVSADIIAAAITSGFHVPNLNDRQRIHSPQNQRRGTTVAPSALDAGDVTSFKKPVRGSAALAARAGTRTAPSRPAAQSPGEISRRDRNRLSGGGNRRQQLNRRPVQVRKQTIPAPTTTTTTTTPLPPPVEDYVYYDDAVYYDDYPADAAAPAAPAPAPTPAPTEAPTEAPTRRAPFRRTLVRPRT